MQPEIVAVKGNRRITAQQAGDHLHSFFKALQPRPNIEQVKARETFVDMEHPVIGKYAHFGPVPRLSDSPGRIARTAPLLGEHNEEIFGNELGMTKDDLAALRASGVI